MSLKKRIFRYIMTSLFAALAFFMAAALLILLIFEDALLKDFESMENAKLDSNVYRAMEALTDWESRDREELKTELADYGYELLIAKDGELYYGTLGKAEKKLLRRFKQENYQYAKDVPEVFYHKKTTIIGMYGASTGAYAMAVHFFHGEWWVGSVQQSFAAFLTVFLLVGTAAIVILLLLSAYFTKKMVKKITEPLDMLVLGAERVKAGDFSEEISYQGEGEFEEVCSTFNAMQKAMGEAQEQRQQNEKARTDMVTGISHDLRTPLTAVRGYIKGILDGVADTPEKKKQYLETAYEGAGEMNVLLQKLFDFSRMESGHLPFNFVEADLGEFAAMYAAQKEPLLEKSRAEISFSQEGTLAEIRMDVEQMRRILDNLLENSLKYAEADPVKISMHMYQAADHIVLEWKDNGKGVPEEKLGKIFERFYRCDEARTKKGSGVGLYVVKYLVEQHGGSIQAQNADGFLIRLCFPVCELPERSCIKGHEDIDCGGR